MKFANIPTYDKRRYSVKLVLSFSEGSFLYYFSSHKKRSKNLTLFIHAHSCNSICWFNTLNELSLRYTCIINNIPVDVTKWPLALTPGEPDY